MEASMTSEMGAKSGQNELLHMHSMPPWKRYESEEEDVSETSSQSVFSPTDGEMTHDSDAEESVSEAEYVDAEMLAPTVYRPESVDDASSLYSHRLSIITAKRSSAATCVPTQSEQDDSTIDDDEDVSPLTEYMTPPLSPIYLSAVCYVPDGSESSCRDESSVEADYAEEVLEVSEAKEVFFTLPSSKPSIVMIQSPKTEAILTARMGAPVQPAKSKMHNEQDKSTASSQQRPSNKRSSSASGMPTPVDRTKRYSAMIYRELNQNGEVTYSDYRSRARSQSSQSPARNSSRPRIGPRKDSLISNASNTTDSSETRQSRPRRVPSQRSSSISSTRSSRYAPDYESPRNYSRPRSIRSSSVASDMTAASSASWRRLQTQNWSSTSLQYPSSSSSIADHPCSSSSSSSSSSPPSSQGENEPKPTPHPLSIITTPTSPLVASPVEFHQSQHQLQSASTTHSSEIDWSPVEYRAAQRQKTFPYSRPRNPSLTLISNALATENPDSPQSRRGSVATAASTTRISTTGRKPSNSMSTLAVMSAAAGNTSKSSGHHHSTSTMKLLMGGFRGLGKQRKS